MDHDANGSVAQGPTSYMVSSEFERWLARLGRNAPIINIKQDKRHE